MDTSKSNNSKASADKDLILPKKPYRTHGGVHVDHMKNTAEVTSEEIPTPKKIIVSKTYRYPMRRKPHTEWLPSH